jgi:hypothetical protein
MEQVGIAQINKNPALIDKLDSAVEIVNKKTKEVKGVFIPVKYRYMIKNILEEIEYQKFLKRNQSLFAQENTEDETLLDGLEDEY